MTGQLEHDADGQHRGRVAVDRRYGHIRVDEVTFCDMGPVLSVWSYEGATLTPDTARELAAALCTWADKAVQRGAA